MQASKIRPNDLKTRIAITTAFAYDCLINKIDCEKTDELINKLKADYKDKKEVKTLIDFYNNSTTE